MQKCCSHLTGYHKQWNFQKSEVHGITSYSPSIWVDKYLLFHETQVSNTLFIACRFITSLLPVRCFCNIYSVLYINIHNEELNDLYSSPNVVRVTKSRRMRWAGHVAHMGEERGSIGSWWGNRRERDHWRNLGVDGWIILGWISRRWDVGMWTGLGWPRIGTGGGRLWVR